jgi:transcriptional regulator with XRE-family HTH domain
MGRFKIYSPVTGSNAASDAQGVEIAVTIYVDDANHSARQLGRLLTRARNARGLTQEEVADGATLSVRALRNLELGRVTRPRRHTIHALINTLAMDSDDSARLRRLAQVSRPAIGSGSDDGDATALVLARTLRETLRDDPASIGGGEVAALETALTRFLQSADHPR